MLSQLENQIVPLYRRILPVKKVLHQHQPIPLKIPQGYYNTPVPLSDSPPTVSIVTPSYNQGQFIERTLQSVLRQNYPHVEYAIQDGGSTDTTLQVLDKYRNRLNHVESQRDGGQAHAINLGFQQTTGQIMAWLNADDMMLPGTIAYVTNFFLQNPQVDVIYGHRIMVNESDHEVGRFILPTHDDTILFWGDYVPQETLFWRRSLWEKVGGYVDESYQFAMDWELLMRFQRVGAKFARLPRFLGAFRVHPDQKTLALNHVGVREMARLRQTQHGRNLSWFEIKWQSKVYLTRLIGANLLYRCGLISF